MYLIENGTGGHPCAEIETHCHYHELSVNASIALIAHTLFDGVSIAAAGYLGESIGLVVLLGVAVHQVPVSLSLASLLSASQFSKLRKKAILSLFALSAPLGYILTTLILRVFSVEIAASNIALLVALAGGTLLYVGASDLLPSVHRHTRDRGLGVLAVLAGFGLAVLAGLLE
jgi:zinc transporter ZupT